MLKMEASPRFLLPSCSVLENGLRKPINLIILTSVQNFATQIFMRKALPDVKGQMKMQKTCCNQSFLICSIHNFPILGIRPLIRGNLVLKRRVLIC